MKPLFNYGISQEDARIEKQILKLKPGDNLLCIASAGEVPLNLITMQDTKITAVDIDPHQIFLSKLKMKASMMLPTEKAARFLGYMQMEKSERSSIFTPIKKSLTPAEQKFWEQHPDCIKKGIINSGRFEKYISHYRPLALFIIGRKELERLMSFKTVEEQRNHFDKKLNTKLLKGLFNLIFHPKLYEKRGIAEKGLSNQGTVNMASFFYYRLRDFCTTTPTWMNYYFQYTFFHKVLYKEALPEYLQPDGQLLLNERKNQLQFFNCSLTECLSNSRTPAFNKIHLSNIGDWMNDREYDEILWLIHQKAAPRTKISSRYIHHHCTIPDTLKPFFKECPDVADLETKTDRYPFYTLVPINYCRR